MDKVKKYYQWFLIALVVIQPFIELDYLIYDQLNAMGLPRFSTILRFIIMPLAIAAGFFLFDRKKKRTLLVSILYLGILGAYFAVHCMNTMKIRNDLYLPNNFVFDLADEFIYVFTMVLPYFLIYMFYEAKLSWKSVKMGVVLSAAGISLPIFISNLCSFGLSTYVGTTKASFLTWFTGIYDIYHPRELASKFYFVEGNTIGIVLFMLLPVVYYYFYMAKQKKEKIALGALIVVQSLSMIILSTRVATYGSVLGACVFIAVMLFCSVVMRNARFDSVSLVFALCVAIMCAAILPYCPATINQQIDNANDVLVVEDNYMIEEGQGEAQANMENAKTKYDPALVFQFEKYGIESNLMSAVPKSYFMEWYKYTHDAYWWLDLLFNVPFYERVNGRQIQTLFIKYKWSETPNPSVDYLLGLGYSEMMNGSLILEQDFVQQFYSFGYLGWPLIVLPWIGVVLFGVIMVLRKFKQHVNMENLIFAAGVLFGLAGAYLSGHVLDEFVSSVMLAFFVAILLKNILVQRGEN